MTKRQSLKLLGELLLDRTNFAIMTRYIACVDNLKMVMVLLRDRSSSIQLGQHGAKRPLPPARLPQSSQSKRVTLDPSPATAPTLPPATALRTAYSTR